MSTDLAPRRSVRRSAAAGTRILAPTVHLLSIDVFDTTLVRRCGSPESLFLLLGRHLAALGTVPTSPEVFARARARADEEIWRRAGSMDADVDLTRIHAEVARLLDLPPGVVPELVARELTLEHRLLATSPRAQRILADARASGIEVAFVSDTYLTHHQLAHLLCERDLLHRDDLCLVSGADHGSKASGAIFEHLPGAGARDGRIVHVGDHPHSDVRSPRRRGLGAAWLPEGRLNRYERILDEGRWESAGLSSSFAGASRLARLHSNSTSPREQALIDVAAGVAAPLLIGYVLWVLERARAEGIARVRFLARDGQILTRIAHELTRRLGLDIDVGYLLVSRRSTNLAATLTADEHDLAWVLRDLEDAPLAASLGRLGLSWVDLASDLEAIGLSATAPVPPWARSSVTELLSSGGVRAVIAERAAAERPLVLDYLRQEGLFGPGRSAIVDLGGIGSQVRAIHTLLSHAGADPPRILLVGLDRPEDAGVRREADDPAWLVDTSCWLFDDRQNLGMRRFRGLVTMLQLFLGADHGTVLGYQRRPNGDLRVVLDEDEHLAARTDWGLPRLHETVVTVAEELLLDHDLVDPAADMRAVACRTLQLLWRSPTAAEARSLGSYPFEAAQAGEADVRPLAGRYSLTCATIGLVRGSFPDLGWQHWYEGSLQLSAPWVRWAARLAEWAYRGAVARDSHWTARALEAGANARRRQRAARRSGRPAGSWWRPRLSQGRARRLR